MPRRWKVHLVVSVAAFVASLDLFIVNIAFPDIARSFGGTSLADLSWVLNAYTVVFAALLVPAGRIADRVGHKATFLAGLLTFVTASALCAAAPGIEALVAARVLQAVGAAILMPTSLALLLPEFPPAQRPVAIGLWAAVGGVAAAAGPPLGGLLVALSWRWVFVVNLPVGLGAAVAAARLLREARDPAQRWPDWLGTALLAGGVGTLALGLVRANAWGWGSAQTLACLAVAAVALAAVTARSARHPSPVVELDLLRVRSFALANATALLFFIAFAGMLLGNVLFLTDVWGWSVLRTGLALAPGPVMAALFAGPGGRLTARYSHRSVAAVGSLLFAAGSAWFLWRATATPHYASDFLPGMLIGGTGVGLVLPSISSAAAASLPPARFATGTAVLTASRQMGSALGVALLVAVLGNPAPGAAVDAFSSGWTLQALAALGAVGTAAAIGAVAHAPAPVAAEAAA